MTERDNLPELVIAYSPQFRLELILAKAQRYRDAGCDEYFFAVRYRAAHPTGHFEYQGDRICFSPGAFEEFAEQLAGIRSGSLDSAELKEVGEMIVFCVERRGRHTRAKIRIREFQPQGELTRLQAGFEVEYDLFVNKLASAVTSFVQSLKETALDEA